MHKLELKIPPLVLVAAFGAAIAALANFFPATNVPFPGHRSLAIAAMLAGVLVAASGVVEFRKARTTVNPMLPGTASSVVTSGIYRLTRNPMYLGMTLVLVGVAAWWASVPGFLLIPAFCAYMTRFQIEPEERALQAAFGEEVSQYMSRVRRWI
jgi:protein-S-isoprenylcysteine O-methyltransferase Ste14